MVNEALANYRFHEAAQGVYQFFWGDFCDWYIEWVKPELQNADRERAVVGWKNLFAGFDAALRLLHPFMPFLTEELWHQLPQRPATKSIALDMFPVAQESWKNSGALEEFEVLQYLITSVRNIRAEQKLDPRKKIAAELSSKEAAVRELVERNLDTILRLAFLSDLQVIDGKIGVGGVIRSTARFDLRIPFAEIVDSQAEIARSKKEIEGLTKDIASKEAQLANETFRSRAPEKIIKGMEATLEQRRVELRKHMDRVAEFEKSDRST
jgi:valyl-tRNA synthetase